MWTVILKHIPLCSLIVENTGKQLPIKKLSRVQQAEKKNRPKITLLPNNKSKGFIFRVHVNVEPRRERETVLTRSIREFWVKLRFFFFFLPQMAPDTTPHFYALSQGKQTEPCSAGTWLVLPPLLWIIWSSQYERHGVGFDWSWLDSLHMKLNFSQCLNDVWTAH